MKKIYLLLLVAGLTGFTEKTFAQLSNDDCFGAQSLGTLGAPAACPSGLGTVSTFNNLTNIGSQTETPYVTLINCQPTNTTPMANPATDVWYSFVNNGNAVNINITGGISNPNIAVYQGSCGGLIGRGCCIGSGNTLSCTIDQMVIGQTYYIQVSGGSPGDQGNFNMTLQNQNSCADCLLSSNLTVNPLPVNGTYQGGTTVTFCYTITQWDQQNTNWLHGVVPLFGNGWNMATLTNLTGAATCDGGPGVWQWFNNIPTPNGNENGFFFDGDIVQGGPDGNPSNNFGDDCQGNVNWTFCWTITAQNCPPAATGADLSVNIDTYGDGETGNWTNVACSNDPVYQFNATLNCCAPPQMTQTNILCFGGNNGSATATPVGTGPFNFSWVNSSNTVIQTANGQAGANSVNNLTAGTYTVTVTDVNNNCVTTGTVNITQPTQLQLLVSSTNASCSQSNGSATVTPQGGVGPYDFVWTDALNNVIQTANNVAGSNTMNNLAQGTYNVLVTDANGCLANISITVQGSPGNLTATVTNTNESCAGACDGTATCTVSGGTGPYTFQWGANAANQTTQTATNLCAGTYTVNYADASNCSGSQTIVVTSPPAVTTTASANPSVICIGQSSTLTAVAGGGTGAGYTYTWTPAGTGTTASVTVSPVVTTVYTVQVSDGNGCPGPIVNVTVTVHPPLNVTLTANPTSICTGGNSTLTAVGTGGNGGPYTYTWLPAGTAGNTSTASVSPAVNTTYTVILSDGCTTPNDSAFVTVSVSPPPVVTFSGTPLTGCAPLAVTFTNNTAGSTSCLWDFGNTITSTNCGPNVNALYNLPGCYNVTLTVTDANNCVGTLTMPNYVCVSQNVNADFSASPQPTNIFETNITFTDLSTGNPNSWTWYFGNLDSSFVENPVYQFPNEQPGCYDVILIANNANNCPDSDTLQVCIDPEYSIYFPNAFTPNGDGINDVFTGVGEGIKKYEMWIFDRWGNLIYYTDDINHPWDGTVQGKSGKICQQDVYVWKASVIDVFDKKHKFIGHVSLIK
ncbi:MAG: gliding motility-associated C-terminal domain-containing protein [Bacteroidetes bacterium]|nr:gliding motility-associated C-terminal domain-containing protein [Bacteroidota bacterium]